MEKQLFLSSSLPQSLRRQKGDKYQSLLLDHHLLFRHYHHLIYHHQPHLITIFLFFIFSLFFSPSCSPICSLPLLRRIRSQQATDSTPLVFRLLPSLRLRFSFMLFLLSLLLLFVMLLSLKMGQTKEEEKRERRGKAFCLEQKRFGVEVKGGLLS